MMKKQAIMLLAGVAALCAAFAPSPSFADTTLTWNGADGAAWEGENWLEADGETPSAWVSGANAVFPSAATVTLSSAVSVSNITAASTLSIGSETVASYDPFLTSTSTLVFPGVTLADITGIDAMMGGANFNSGNSPAPARAYHFSGDANTVTVQIQAAYKTNVRCVRVELTQGEDGVYARAISPTGYAEFANNNTSLGYVGCDANLIGTRWTQNIATSPTSNGYGVYALRASVARLGLSGEAAFGGDLATSNVTIDVTAPIAQTWAHKVTMQGGTFNVTGGDATVDTTYGITDASVAGAAAAWLTANASDTVFTNMVLASMVPVGAVLRGSSIGYNATATTVHHIRRDGMKMTCQFQHWATGIKCVLVEFAQSGSNVTARAVQSYWWDDDYGVTQSMIGTDVVAEFEGGNTEIKKYTITQYGVKSLVLRTPVWPSLTFGAGGRIDDLIVDAAQVSLESASAGTYFIRCLAATNSANVTMCDGANSSNSGEGCSRRFASGSSFFCLGALRTSARAAYELDDSFVYLPLDHWQQHDGNNYLCDVTLKNGAQCFGSPLRCGYYNPSNVIEIVSAGATASTNAAGINLCYHNYNVSVAETNTVVLRTDADLAVTGKIYDSPSWSGALLVKRGDATLTLSGNNTFVGRLTVEAGTLALGSDTALPASAPLTLAGGTMTCGSSANSTGALALSGNATIALGSGSLVFADSSGESWSSGATLNITGPEGFPVTAIRFGTDGAGLTSSQLRRIRYNGSKVSLTDEGYLGGPRGMVIAFR